MIGRPRHTTERELAERVRNLERELEVAVAATRLDCDVPCWVVDPDWLELRDINQPALALLRLASPTTAAELLARIDHRDHVALGEAMRCGGHVPALRVLRPDGKSRRIGVVAIPRATPAGAEVMFFAWDLSDDTARAGDEGLAARIAAQSLHVAPQDLWAAVARELRFGCRADGITIVDARRPDHLLAIDPPGAAPSAGVGLVHAALAASCTLTHATYAVPVGSRTGVVVLVDGPGDAAVLLDDETATRAVLDGLADHHSLTATQFDALVRARDHAIETAARAEADRAAACAAADEAVRHIASVADQLADELDRVAGFAQMLAQQPLAAEHHHTLQHIVLAARRAAPLVERFVAVEAEGHLGDEPDGERAGGGSSPIRWLGSAPERAGA